MPSLAVVRASNAAFAPNYRPVALFVGGTSGIGQAMAQGLAKHTKGNAHIIICGRNKDAADSIISTFPTSPSTSPGGGSRYEFLSCDATLMSNVKSTTTQLLRDLPKLNFLVVSPGFLSFKGRDETSEGLDKKLALNYYARWKFVYELLPLLQKAKESGEEARVVTVLAAGMNGKINLDDLEVKKSYGLKSASDAASTYNDFMVEDFAAKNPSISFTHIFPGIVRTPMVMDVHWTMKYFTPLMKLFTVSPEECAEWMLYPMLNPEFQQGAFYRTKNADDAGKNTLSTPETRKAVWDHTVEMTKVDA